MDRRVVRFFAPALTLIALAALAFTAACGGGGDDETPEPTATSEAEVTPTQEVTATSTEAVATATQTSATTTPTEDAGDDEPGQTPVPEGTENFQVTLDGGPDAGTYEGAYDDASPICIEGGPAPVNVVFFGDDRAGSGKFINLTLLANPDEPDQLFLQLNVSGDDSQNEYKIAPPEGSGTLTVDEQETVTMINVTGTAADGTPLELIVECHPAAS